MMIQITVSAQHQCQHCTMEGITDPDSTIQIKTVLPFDNKVSKVSVAVKDGVAYWQGDIILGNIDDLLNLEKGLGINGQVIHTMHDSTHLFWPNNTIPYVINSGFSSDQLDDINQAIDDIKDSTNLNLILRTNEVNYVTFNVGTGCSAWIGMTNKWNDKITEIFLGTGCSLGNIKHEILHTAGMNHEQNRGDRDTYITINWANITSSPPSQNATGNFVQTTTNYTDYGPYDYGSIMHYGTHFFSTNGQPTITINMPPGNSSTVIGQRFGMSATDVASINAIYPVCNSGNPYTITGDIESGRYMSNNPIELNSNAELDANEFIHVSGGQNDKVTCKPGTKLKAGSEVKISLEGCH